MPSMKNIYRNQAQSIKIDMKNSALFSVPKSISVLISFTLISLLNLLIKVKKTVCKCYYLYLSIFFIFVLITNTASAQTWGGQQLLSEWWGDSPNNIPYYTDNLVTAMPSVMSGGSGANYSALVSNGGGFTYHQLTPINSCTPTDARLQNEYFTATASISPNIRPLRVSNLVLSNFQGDGILLTNFQVSFAARDITANGPLVFAITGFDIIYQNNRVTTHRLNSTTAGWNFITLLPGHTYEFRWYINKLPSDCGGSTFKRMDNPEIDVQMMDPITVSGNIFNDNNGLTGGPNGTATGGPGSPSGQLYVNLVNSSGKVVDTAPVASNGTYSLSSDTPGSFTTVLSTVQGTVGQTAPAPSLPSGWFSVSESDGSPNLTNTITTTGANITGVNFGINQPPVAVNDGLTNRPSGSASTIPNLLSNDTDPNSGTLSPGSVSLTTPGGATSIITTSGNVTGFTVPGQGVWSYNPATGALTFTPQAAFTGNPTPVNYTVKDAAGLTSNSAQVSITYLPPSTDVSVIKTASNMTPVVGNPITFTITVANAGPNNATGVSMKDVLPSGYLFVSATPSVGTYANGTSTWTIGNLANGTNATLTVRATVNTTGTYANTATVTSTTNDPDLTNNTSTVTPCAAPTAPVVGAVTQPTCSVATGSVVLNGLPATGNWTIAQNNGTTTTTISGTGATKTISGLAAGNYTFTVANGACPSAASASVVINAQPSTPTAPIAGTVTQPTCSVATGSVVLNGLPATGNWIIAQSNGTTTRNIPGTGTTKTIIGLAAGSYTFTVANGTCPSVASASVIINAQPATPTAPIAGTVTQPTCSVATGSVVLNGLPATGNWTITQSNGTTTTTITRTGATTTITGLASGNYTFRVTNAASCISPASASVTINTQPAPLTAPTIGTITQPTSSVATGSVVLNGLPATGNWTITQNNGVTISSFTGRGATTTITGLAPGVYTFTVTNGASCTSPASASVTINTQPVLAQCPSNLQQERITPTTNFYDFNGTGINTNIAFSSITSATGSNGGLGWAATGTGVFHILSGASEFNEDNANQTLSRPITNANLGGNGAVVAITIRPSKGVTTFGNDPSVPATLQIIYNGVTYATFQTAFNTTTNVAITTANGATSSNSAIPGVLTPVPGVGFTTVTFTLPANIANSGTFSLQFNANGGSTPADDYAISAISFKSCPANISGNVFNDNNGTTGGVNGTAIGGAGSPTGQLYVNLVNTSGNVEAVAVVASDGSYSLPASASGAYTVQLSTVQGTVGSAAPTASLPSGWFPVSETDGSPNLSNAITVANTSNANITGTNFGINQPPVAVNDALANQPSGIAATIPDLLVNDSDPNGDTLLPGNVSLAALGGATSIITTSGNVTGFTVPGEGSWDYNSTTGALTFTPQPGFIGNPTPINYTVKDAAGLTSNSAQASITYAAPDPLPVATDDLDYFNGNSPKTIDVLANDNTGDTVVPTTVSIVDGSNPDAQNEFLTKVVPDEGTWTVNPTTGAITFSPLPTFNGDPTPISYTVKDAQGNVSNPASVTLKVPSIRLTKTGIFVDANGNGNAEIGEKINYTFKVENTSDVAISDLLITDPKVTVTGGPITLAPGASDASTFTAIYTLTQADLDAGQVNNLATATGKDPKGNPVTDTSENGNPVDPDHPAPPTCTDCTVTPVPQTGSIRLTKTGTFKDANGDGKAQVGETVTYTFKVENTGNVTVSDITITDPKVTVTGGPITLAPSASDASTFTATYTLTQADLDAGQVNNLATATGKDPKGNPVTDTSENGNPVDPNHPAPPTCTDCTVTPVPQTGSIRLIKTGTFKDANGDGKAQVGETVTYTFKVENTGNVTVSDITITDPKVTITGGPITLAPGASDASIFTATYTLTQADLDAGQVNNLATATGKDPKGNPVTDTSENGNPVAPDYPAPPTCTDCTVTPVPTSPAIRLTKTGTFRDANGDGKAQVGETVTYTFKVENTGNVTVSDIKITDPKVTITGGPITLAPGASDASTFTATYILTQADLDAGQVNNLATATGKDPKGNPVTDTSENGNPVDPNHPAPPTCTDCTVTPVPQTGSIRLTKTGTFKDANGDGKAKVGETVTYTFKVENTGNVTVSDIKITDPKVTVTGGPITLAPGASDATTFTATYTLTQADLDAGQVNNLATATGKDPKGNPVTDTSENGNPVDPDHPAPPTCTDCTVTPVPQTGSIRLIKTGTFKDANGDGKAQVGETVTYTFKVENTGNVTVSDITITDPKVIITGGPITLAPGTNDASTFTATYILTQADLDAGQVNNLATATGKDPKGNPVTDTSENGNPVDPNHPAPPTCTDCTVTPIPQTGSIRLTKTGTFKDANGDGKAQVGETVTYTFKVENTGNVTVSDIKITDPKVTVTGGPITLAPGASDATTFTATYTLTQADLDAGQVNNLATATGKDPKGNTVTDTSENGNPVDPNHPAPPTCTDCTVTPVPQTGSIRLIKTGTFKDANGDGKAQVGETVTYTFKVENTGNVTVSDIKITDPKVTVTGGPITLAPGASDASTFTATYTLTQADLDAEQVNNLATATGKDPKGNPVTDTSENGNPVDPDHPAPPTCTDCTVTPVPQTGAIALVKQVTNVGTGTNGAFLLGNTIEYTFTIKNTGNVILNNLVLTDLKISATPFIISGSLLPGASTSIKKTYVITAADIATHNVTNTAVVTATDPKGNPVTDKSGSNVDNDDPTVTSVSQPPIANNDKASTKQNFDVNIPILINDVAGSSPINPASVVIVTNPTHGTLTINPDGTVTYKPEPNYSGPDSFVYTVKDQNGLTSNPATVTIDVIPSKPVAIDDVAKTSFNTPVDINILLNDKEDGSPFQKNSVEIIDKPLHGTIRVNADGTVTYTPFSGYTGTDTFTYRVKDANGNWTNIATGTITIEGFFIPNVFTPNGDGKNDTFFIIGLAAFDSVNIEVYNRWGGQVYKMNGYQNNWTGDGLSEGTYFYKIVLKKGGSSQTVAGPVLLKR
jgi:uncharacterized repeat protein (TIGR01451 family)/gliding motility-associated-like protein